MTAPAKKCLLLYTKYLPLVGGAQTVYDALATHAGGQVEILTSYKDIHTGEDVPGWREFDASANYTIHRLPFVRARMGCSFFTNPIGWFWQSVEGRLIKMKVLRTVERLLATGDYATLCIGDMPFLGWLLNHKQRLHGVRTIIYSHGEELSQAAHSKKHDVVRRRAIAQADAHIAVSSFTVDLLVEKYGVSRETITLSTNGVDLTHFNGTVAKDTLSRLGIDKTGPIVFACGRLVERKGFDKLIEAWPTVMATVPSARLLIGGEGPIEDALKARVKALELSESINFMGRLSVDDLPSVYGLADVFAMPNRTMPDGDTEGFGLVFLEAAAMGTPSVGGRAGGAVDAIVDGETGLFVDGYKSSEIASALTQLLTNSEKREAMGKAALAYAKTQGWQAKTDALLPLLTSQGGEEFSHGG